MADMPSSLPSSAIDSLPTSQPSKSQRSSGTVSLWAHLLRNEYTPSQPRSTESALPLAVPTDKTSTSMRILLHDTQANFEKFSAKLDKLHACIDETKKDIVAVKSQFVREHDEITEQMADLVNRSQTEVQKSVKNCEGAISNLGLSQKDIMSRCEALDRRLETTQTLLQSQNQTILSQHQSLEKRIDLLQSLYQIQVQAFETQTKTIQTLQEQHAAIMPLISTILPLIQALPVQIDSARGKLSDAIIQSAQTSCQAVESLFKSPRKRRASSVSRHENASPARKRQKHAHAHTSSRSRISPQRRSGSGAGLSRLSSINRGGVLDHETLGMSTDSLAPASIPGSSEQPPRVLRMHNSLVRRNEHGPSLRSRLDATSPGRGAAESQVPIDVDSTPLAERYRNRSRTLQPLTVTDAPKIASPDVLSPPSFTAKQPTPALFGTLSPQHRPPAKATSVPPPASTSKISQQKPDPVKTSPKSPRVHASLNSTDGQAQNSGAGNVAKPTAMLARGGSVRPPMPMPMSLNGAMRRGTTFLARGQRSPLREGRRFIPLDDSDDD